VLTVADCAQRRSAGCIVCHVLGDSTTVADRNGDRASLAIINALGNLLGFLNRICAYGWRSASRLPAGGGSCGLMAAVLLPLPSADTVRQV
jgi:hypothetical protein